MLAMLLLLLSTTAQCAPTDKAQQALECEVKTREFDHAREEINYQPQNCRKDRDCVLLFQGKKLRAGCDLGVSASRKVMGPGYFTRLNELQAQAEAVCPPPAANLPKCKGVPAKRAVCRDQVCDTK